MLSAVIGVADKTGEIKVTLTSKGLPDCVVTLDAVRRNMTAVHRRLKTLALLLPSVAGQTRYLLER